MTVSGTVIYEFTLGVLINSIP